MASFGALKSAIFDSEERKQQYQGYIRGLNAYERHKKFVNDYVSYYGQGKSSTETLPVRTDQDTLREGYRFIRSEEDDMGGSWEQRLVKRYYDKLFKEYCLADMSKYKSGKIGLRWRTRKEVISGKGQFICGNKHCVMKNDLASYEVNFVYFEAGEDKQVLVKLVACKRCAEKLQYKRNKEREQLEKEEKEVRHRKRERSTSDEEDLDQYGNSDLRKRSGNGEEGRDEYSKNDKKINVRGLSEEKQKKRHKRMREMSKVDASADKRLESEKTRRKGKTEASDTNDEDEDFDEFLEGMFP